MRAEAPADPLDQLEDLLFELPDSDEAMLLSELDGYLAGWLVSPHQVAQEDWLKPIWGGGDEAFCGDPVRSARLVSLILARKAQMAVALLRGDLAYQPIFDVDERYGETLWALWAEGFGRAIEVSGNALDSLFEAPDEDLGAAARGLAMYVAMARAIPTTNRSDEDAGERAPQLIPWLVETLYRRQRGLSRTELTEGLPGDAGSAAKAGRNAPCPCGSGKKFKRCCGR